MVTELANPNPGWIIAVSILDARSELLARARPRISPGDAARARQTGLGRRPGLPEMLKFRTRVAPGSRPKLKFRTRVAPGLSEKLKFRTRVAPVSRPKLKFRTRVVPVSRTRRACRGEVGPQPGRSPGAAGMSPTRICGSYICGEGR